MLKSCEIVETPSGMTELLCAQFDEIVHRPTVDCVGEGRAVLPPLMTNLQR